MGFHHLSLNCNDMLAIERFYSQHFDFHRARVIDLPDGRQIVFLRNGAVYLELFPAQGARPASPDTNKDCSTPACVISPSRWTAWRRTLRRWAMTRASLSDPCVSMPSFPVGAASGWPTLKAIFSKSLRGLLIRIIRLHQRVERMDSTLSCASVKGDHVWHLFLCGSSI